MTSQRWLSFNFFTFFFTWGVFLPYWTGYLVNAKHLTVSQAGFIMGAGLLLRGVSTLVIYPLTTKLYSMVTVVRLFTILSLIVMFFYYPADGYVSLLIITLLFNGIYPNILPSVESSAALLIKTDGIHYGKARSYGSLGYTVALLMVGVITEFLGINAVLWVMIIGLAAILVTQLLKVPTVLKEKPSKLANITDQRKSMLDVVKEKGFLPVLIIAVLLQGAHAGYYNYGYLFLEDLHASNFQIGLILNVAVIIEILIFAFADRLFANTKLSTLFLIAAVGSTVRWTMIFLFPNITVFIVSQLLHAVSFGIAHYAFIQYISRHLVPNSVPVAQGIYAAFGMSFSVALLTFLGGYLYDIEPSYTFAGMLICSVPALLLVLWSRKRFNY